MLGHFCLNRLFKLSLQKQSAPYTAQGNRTIKLSRIEPAHDNQDFEKP